MAQEEGSSAWTFVFEGNPNSSPNIEPLPLQKTPTPPAQILISSPKPAIQKKKTVQKTNINQTKWKFMGSRSKIHKVGVHFDKHSQYLGNWKDSDGNPSSPAPSSPTLQPTTAPVNLLTRTKKQLEKNILHTAHSPFKSFPTSRYSLPDFSPDDDNYDNNYSNNSNHNQHQFSNNHRNHHTTTNNTNSINNTHQLSLEDEPLTLKCYNSEPIYQPLSVQRSSSVDSPFVNFHNPYEHTQLAPSSFSSEHLNLMTGDVGSNHQLNLSAFSNSINSINSSLNFPPTQYSAPVPLQRSFSHNSPLQLQTTSLQLVHQQPLQQQPLQQQSLQQQSLQQSLQQQSQPLSQQQQPLQQSQPPQQSMIGQLHPSLLHLQSNSHSSQPAYQPLVLNLDNFEQGAHLLHTEYYNHYQM